MSVNFEDEFPSSHSIKYEVSVPFCSELYIPLSFPNNKSFYATKAFKRCNRVALSCRLSKCFSEIQMGDA